MKPEIDSFRLLDSNGASIALNRVGVSWPDDKTTYKNSGDLSKQIIDNTDEAWLVWFRPAAKSSFFKLHSKIEVDLPKGNYTFQATDAFDVSFG